jgi:tetratricopeptide (TPR) repeat protein
MSNANAALHELLVAGHLEQVVSQARRILDRQPESIPTHYYLALALLRLRRSGEAWVSVQILLERLPNAGFAHHAASEYFSLTRKYRKAREHIRQALALESHSAPFHYDACRAALRLRKIREAREEIDAARQLDPRDADIIRLYVLVHGLNQDSARSAWERVRQLETGISIDPTNAGLHETLGDIFLAELDQPGKAEEHYRESLLRDPVNRSCQKALFQAVARQRFMYRLLSIPSRAWTWTRDVLRGCFYEPWRLIFVLLAIKAVLMFFVWLVVATVLFWPACKVYEWLVVAEIQSAGLAPARWLSFKRRLSRRPFWMRFGVCIVLIIGLWIALFKSLRMPLRIGFLVLGTFAAIHSLALLVETVSRRIRSRYALQSLAKSGHPPGR